MTREEILGFIDRWQDAVNRRDVEAYSAMYAEDAEIHSPLAGALTGRDGAARSLQAFLSAFPDVVYTSEPAIVDGDRVARVSTLAGTNVGGLLGLPPSGKPFRLSIVFVLQIKDGQIVREQRIYDFTGLLVQVGVLKAKPV